MMHDEHEQIRRAIQRGREELSILFLWALLLLLIVGGFAIAFKFSA